MHWAHGHGYGMCPGPPLEVEPSLSLGSTPFHGVEEKPPPPPKTHPIPSATKNINYSISTTIMTH